ncbi:MAG: glycosyltransferase family 39 protein [Anaerolineales bacterium]|nr:glycosyltransferase family 39 protein [Anaerolineales bacterium]
MKENTSFFASKTVGLAVLLTLLILGAAIRMHDLTDLPLDFHPTRQLLSALKARGIYYETLRNVSAEQKSFAIQQWKVRAAIEPEIIENIVAYTYRFTGEHLWIARIYSSLFWLIGGFFLFLLVRDLTSVDGALASTAVYLFLPFAVTASRSFQPDPLMVMLIIIFWWAVYQWSKNPASYSFAILAGIFGGFSIFVKLVAVFFVIGGGLGVLFRRLSLRDVLKQPQIYVMTFLGILPGAAYTIYGVFVAGYLGQQFGGRFIPSLFLSPSYYLGWLGMLNAVVGGAMLMFALLGLFFFVDEKRRFVTALWIGYFIFGLYFNYHISSHDYYSLPLIPIVALSIAPVAEIFLSQLAKLTTTRWLRFSALGLLSFGIFASLWNIRADMKSVDYRPEAQMWAEIGEKTSGHNLAGLTQDYGSRLAYWGWLSVTPWPTFGDLNYHNNMRGAKDDFEKQFEELTLKKDLFIVTDFVELGRQPLLKNRLSQYLIFAQNEKYVIYSLH